MIGKLQMRTAASTKVPGKARRIRGRLHIFLLELLVQKDLAGIFKVPEMDGRISSSTTQRNKGIFIALKVAQRRKRLCRLADRCARWLP